ncbi:MAG: glycoside hydrolase family 3 C-terminal domain-containing protein [Clostridiales bacterium]|nr:glycoside hydrolase family 3 C-terminal domain-containing protein [Clostridiales bacterium]
MTKSQAFKKAKEIVSKMTTDEKLSQLVFDSPAIERLGIHEYNWWNESLHGVARAGTATVFPQAIGFAATFDPELLRETADAISTEGRAKYNKSVEYGDRDIFKGLTYWSPNINIFRDPRWGRGHETYGEDPCLTSIMGKAFIGGLQGDGEFLKAAACSKHFAVHSGPEDLRHGFDAVASKKDMAETYLPAFEQTVKSGVAGVMGAYNRVNGVPCNADSEMITGKLRGEWGFDGYFVSDCGAIQDIYEHHKYRDTPEECAAAALNAGCDLNCGSYFKYLYEAYEQDLVSEERITEACETLYTIRVLLGEFEEENPFAGISYRKVDCPEHKALNLKVAESSLVLLKNENSFLPLDKEKKYSIGVIGPNAMNIVALEGNYEGRASEYITPADGFRRVFTSSEIRSAEGSRHREEQLCHWDGFKYLCSDALAVASVSDIVVLCLGLDRNFEGEGESGDKADISLPETQRKMAEAVCDVCENVIVVMMCGSSLDIGDTLRNKAKAIIQAWYPGAVGGLAVAKAVAGEFSPCGRLPISIYRGDTVLPDFTDYSMKNRTYRFNTEPVAWQFGFGIGYTKVNYVKASVNEITDDTVKIDVTVENTGKYDTTEKIQIYAKFADSRTETPVYQLCGIKALEIPAGGRVDTCVVCDRYWIKAVLESGERVEPDGEITLFVGSSLPDELSVSQGAPEPVEIKVR